MHHKPIYRLYETNVKRIVDVTPRMRRVTLGGEDLAHFARDRPGQWVKLFFDNGADGRAFSIGAWRPEECEMDVNFVVHGHGLAGRWLETAKVGSIVQIAGPRSNFSHIPGKQLFLLGDETAISAISAILEGMQQAERTVVVLEASTPEAVQPLPAYDGAQVSWIISDRQPGVLLAEYAKTLTVNPDTSQVWVACEATAARELRCAFGRIGFDRSALHVSGYWKCGEIEHVDQDSDY
ncbi:siderophore-interacting protein [Sphingomonas ginsenosidivorax]|uniref:Siderophore-interacting protein n=1 Tax=Sphingomonas ginsenosidivorax TaxID=862135 RepID=A0A5C6U557_9SPHN|nr:siderophore-interacting protein [Sphingomonas ginsenosidivorax]TXC68004.1 siderophore-interacting protein [Sphingomonas ginsenosidivorax]